MPESVFYIRGFPSSLFDSSALSPDMLADLKEVAALSDTDVTALSQRLASAKGFLDPKALAATIRQVVHKEDAAQSVRRALRNLGPKDIEPLLEVLADQAQEKDFPLAQDLLGRLAKILPELIQTYPALARFEKAERLAKLTGQQLESVDLICDLRPIFDESRTRLEGMMPYTRLRLVAKGADGLPNAFEAELSAQAVQDLAEKAAKAIEKLDVLRKTIESVVPEGLPDLPLTRAVKTESTDA